MERGAGGCVALIICSTSSNRNNCVPFIPVHTPDASRRPLSRGDYLNSTIAVKLPSAARLVRWRRGAGGCVALIICSTSSNRSDCVPFIPVHTPGASAPSPLERGLAKFNFCGKTPLCGGGLCDGERGRGCVYFPSPSTTFISSSVNP